MEELIKKLAKPIAEISDRAVLTINSKLSNRVTTIEELLEIENSIIAGLVLHWINERQTHANINTLHAALKILQDIALVPKGHYSLVTLGCIEFLNSYYNHVPTSLQTVVSGILNSLVTPSFKPIERQVPIFSSEPEIPTNIYPSSELPTFIKPKQHSKIHIDDSQPISIQEHCEYPPVLLCDSDEKLLFDICVLIKFGNTEEMIESCNDVQYSILLNYPVDSLLQRPDIIRSVVSLANAALSKGAFEVTHKALKVMESILIKLDNFSSQINKAEYRAASCTPKKALIPVEHIGISVPCLKNEQWEVGTPGLTLSVLAACELIITGIPLNEGKLVGVSIKT